MWLGRERRGREYKELFDLFTYSLLIVCFLFFWWLT